MTDLCVNDHKCVYEREDILEIFKKRNYGESINYKSFIVIVNNMQSCNQLKSNCSLITSILKCNVI